MSLKSLTGIQVENQFFPPVVTPPGSTKQLFLGGAGARGLNIQDKFVKFTAIGVYLEDSSLPSLAANWKGKAEDDLTASDEFFIHIVTGNFEKMIQVTMILPLTGSQYAEKVTENCVANWKSSGSYTDSEANAVEKFINLFKDEKFPPGSSIIFTQSPGRLTISFSEDGSVPGGVKDVIENGRLGEAILESIVGKHGVSPEAKSSLASRISEILRENEVEEAGRVNQNPKLNVMGIHETATEREEDLYPLVD